MKKDIFGKIEIKSYTPEPRKVEAVHYRNDKLLIRLPIRGWVVITKETDPTSFNKKTGIRNIQRIAEDFVMPCYWQNGSNQIDFSVTQAENYLGLEFNGEKQTWELEIARYKKKNKIKLTKREQKICSLKIF